ncbi:hypothetical protein [Bradyrhizobium sp. sGM-13]|uniref:hypothetical protein n=1 Tax=Bradyrhizobium sp. sGM-13 TaxID=2831781 RepID=UPI001BD0159A|nr:hypothetical protein [Bradyrhizobium sp. sGM-13]
MTAALRDAGLPAGTVNAPIGVTGDDGTDIGRNGYRSAKPQGKPTFTIGHFSLCRRCFSDFRGRRRKVRVYTPFIANLKLPFKFVRP